MFESEQEMEYMMQQYEELEKEQEQYEKYLEGLEEDSINFELAQRQKEMERKAEEFRKLFAEEL